MFQSFGFFVQHRTKLISTVLDVAELLCLGPYYANIIISCKKTLTSRNLYDQSNLLCWFYTSLYFSLIELVCACLW